MGLKLSVKKTRIAQTLEKMQSKVGFNCWGSKYGSKKSVYTKAGKCKVGKDGDKITNNDYQTIIKSSKKSLISMLKG